MIGGQVGDHRRRRPTAQRRAARNHPSRQDRRSAARQPAHGRHLRRRRSPSSSTRSPATASTSAWRFRSWTTFWTWSSRPKRWAKPRARTPRSTRSRFRRSMAWSDRAPWPKRKRLAAHLALRPFDERAERLRELADLIVHRRAMKPPRRNRLDRAAGGARPRRIARESPGADHGRRGAGQRAEGRQGRRERRRRSRHRSCSRSRATSAAAASSSKPRSSISRIDVRRPRSAWTSAPPPADSPIACCNAAPRASTRSMSGTGQLDWKLRNDPARDRPRSKSTRAISDRSQIPEPIDLAVCDVSFISVTMILPALAALLASHGGNGYSGEAAVRSWERQQVGKGGIVRDPALHRRPADRVEQAVQASGLSDANHSLAPSWERKAIRSFFCMPDIKSGRSHLPSREFRAHPRSCRA